MYYYRMINLHQWSSMEDQMGDTHIYQIQDRQQLGSEKTHSKKMTRETITYGKVILPKHEH